MRHILAILIAFPLVLGAASASAQPENPFVDDLPPPPPAASAKSPATSTDAKPSFPPPSSPVQRQTCAEELEEARIENAYLKGRVEARENSHFQLWPDSPLAVAAFLGPWAAWVLVMIVKGIAGSGSSTRKAGGTKPPTPPKKKEDEEE